MADAVTMHGSERRERALWLSWKELTLLLSARFGGRRFSVAVLDLPEGAELRRVVVDDLHGGVWFVFVHESFGTVPDRAQPPTLWCNQNVYEMPEGVTHPPRVESRDPDIIERFGEHIAALTRSGVLERVG